MPFPPAFLDELRARVPLSALVGRRVRLVRAGREFKACCPFHHEKTPSFYVNDGKQFYHCFGCGAHGDVIGFTMRHDRLSFPEAIAQLAGEAGIPVPTSAPDEREAASHEKRLRHALESATAWFEDQLFRPAGREGVEYFRARGLSDETIRRFHLGYAPREGSALVQALKQAGCELDDLQVLGLTRADAVRGGAYSFFRHRVLFPVSDRRGRTVAFGGRVLGEGEPKYLNSPEHPLFHKGKTLYSLSRARGAMGEGQPLIVVEGYMDVIALAENGYAGAVAPLGTALTEDQLALLWQTLPPAGARGPDQGDSPILCFDGDTAGRRAAARALDRALPLLTPDKTLRIAWMPEGADPDSLIRSGGRAAFAAVLERAQPLAEALWSLALAGQRTTTPEERGRVLGALRRQVAQIGDETLRRLYEDDIRRRFAETFRAPARAAASGGVWDRNRNNASFQGGGTFRGAGGIVGGGSALAPRKPTDVRRKIGRTLLALVLNHPPLFAEVGEDLARVSFDESSLEAVRAALVTFFSQDGHESLDAAEVYRHVSGEQEDSPALRKGLVEVLSESTYADSPAAKPDRPQEEVRAAWHRTWRRHVTLAMEADLKGAQARYSADPSDDNLARVMALQACLESARSLGEDAA